MLGFCKWFDQKRGYGFLIDNDTGLEYFFHFTAIISEDGYKTLAENQKISFDKDETEKDRLRAKNIRKV